MRLLLSRRRRGLAYALLVAALSACGGGSETGAGQPAAATAPPDATTAAGKARVAGRRTHAFDRQGITALAVARDGHSVAVASSDGRVRLMDGSASQELRLVAGPGKVAVTGLVYSADGRLLVAIGRDSGAQVWDVASGTRRFSLRGHEHALRAVAASADGAVVVTGGEETRVMLWDGRSGRLHAVLSGPSDFVDALALSADARWLAAGDASGRLLVWDLAARPLPAAAPAGTGGHAGANGALAGAPTGAGLGARWAAPATTPATTPAASHTGAHTGAIAALAFAGNTGLLASAGRDGQVLLWQVGPAGAQLLHRLTGQRGGVRSLAFNPTATLLAGAGDDGWLLVWDVATRSVRHTVQASTRAVNVVAFGAGQAVLIAGDAQDRVSAWTLAP